MFANKLTYWNEVEIPPWRDYEKPTTPLRVLPDNDEITVVVVYSIRYNNETCAERLALSEAEVSRRDPQLGRPALSVVEVWFALDPATVRESVWTEQFHNPYLAMGNNPVMYTDPNGEWSFLVPLAKSIAIGAGIGGASYIAQTGFSEGGFDNWNNKHFYNSMLYGGISGGMSFGIGQMNLGQLGGSFMHAFGQGALSELRGGDFQTGMSAGFFSSMTSATLLSGGGAFGSSTAGNLALSGLAGGLSSHAAGGNFWQGFGTGVTVAGLNHFMHLMKRPSFEDLMKHFPVDSEGDALIANRVYKLIGGQVEAEYNRDPAAYGNACALRVCKALNGAGVDIPEMGRQTLQGADGKNYFYRASNLYQWMLSTYGKPNFSTTNYSSLKGNTGIYIMQAHYPRDFGAWGHATLYNLNGTIGNPYNNSHAFRLNLWNFK